MPKYAIHHIVLTDAIGQLLASDDSSAHGAGEILALDMPAANLGAIGPDLFFWAPDYTVVKKLQTLYQNYAELAVHYEAAVQPVRDVESAVGGAIADYVGDLSPGTVGLIRGAIEQLGNTAEAFKRTVSTGLFSGVIEGADLLTDAAGFPTLAADFFHAFRPPLQDGKAENCWYWFDMLHYRRTGDFGRRLVENAKNGAPQERAFAYGYLSHIYTDLVGHAYVNQVSGGPFRLQVQRHVTSENWMDTWKFQEHYGENINRHLFRKLDLPDSLDPKIGDLLHQTLRDVYEEVDHPRRLPGSGFLARDELDATYETLVEVLKLMQSQAVTRPEEPFSGVAAIFMETLGSLFEMPPAPPDVAGNGGLSLEQLEEWFDYVGELLNWSIGRLFAILDFSSTQLLLLSIGELLACLYGLQLLMYEIWQIARSTLALTGFVYPEPGDLNGANGQSLTTPVTCGLQACGATGPVDAEGGVVYPRLTSLGQGHLICPPPRAELPTTTPNVAAASPNTTPESFISQEPFDLRALMAYAESPSPARTRRLARGCLRMGNATDLTAFAISVAANDSAPTRIKATAHANWNLDSDRGYGYKTWVGRSRIAGESRWSADTFVIDRFVDRSVTPDAQAQCPDA